MHDHTRPHVQDRMYMWRRASGFRLQLRYIRACYMRNMHALYTHIHVYMYCAAARASTVQLQRFARILQNLNRKPKYAHAS